MCFTKHEGKSEIWIEQLVIVPPDRQLCSCIYQCDFKDIKGVSRIHKWKDRESTNEKTDKTIIQLAKDKRQTDKQ